MASIYVKPARPGMALWHEPSSTPGVPKRYLPDEGGWWPDDSFTHRRLNENPPGVVQIDPPGAAKPESAG